jgi:hypothetical protein
LPPAAPQVRPHAALVGQGDEEVVVEPAGTGTVMHLGVHAGDRTVDRADSASSANGLSQTTARPRRNARSVSVTWVAAGVEIATASAPAPASSTREAKAGRARSSETWRPRSGEVVTTPRNSQFAAEAISGA